MSTLKADTIQSTGGGAATLTKQEATKVRIRFNAGTSINDSFNVASLSDDGTGNYHYTFTNNMSDTNYTHVGMGGNVGITDDTVTTALANIGAFNASGSAVDDTRMNGLVTGDLA
jgi:hypothetical protein